MKDLFKSFESVRNSATVLAVSPDSERQQALRRIADSLNENKDRIFAENQRDLENAKASGIPSAILHRLEFSDEKLRSVSKGLCELALLADPIGKTREKRELDPGFILEKRTFPIGVIGMIFEARPDALVQIAGLALRSGNGIILKGGKEAALTNRILVETIKKATSDCSFGDEWILGIESHEDVSCLLKAEGSVDLLIPRGSNAFVRYVMDNTRIPVIGHADGICTTYIDESADFAKGVKIRAEKSCLALMPHATEATEKDFHTEFLSLECAVRTVSSVKEAVSHIQSHGSHHTDAILTQSREAADYFTANVDSADVFVNCSTRFADGFRFGLGAEVGISTSKLHARGPVGLDGLMTTKWILTGNGETVAMYSGPEGRPFHHKELM